LYILRRSGGDAAGAQLFRLRGRWSRELAVYRRLAFAMGRTIAYC
jgi:hypothetical protein